MAYKDLTKLAHKAILVIIACFLEIICHPLFYIHDNLKRKITYFSNSKLRKALIMTNMSNN